MRAPELLCYTVKMPRKRGPQSADSSVVLAVRTPHDIAEAVYAKAGAASGRKLAQWLRSVLTVAVGRPLNYEAGYEEGRMAGWNEASKRFREALKGAKA